MAYSSKNGLRKHLLMISGMTTATLFVLTFFLRGYLLSFILLVPVGFFNIMFMNTANALFQVYSPNEYRGRVVSVYAFINQGSYPIGNAFAGLAMQYFGGGSGFMICGFSTFAGLLALYALKRKKLIDWLSNRQEQDPLETSPQKE